MSTENTKYHSAGNCLIETASKSLILGNNASVIPTDGSVTSITSNAFRDCTSLTSIEIPNSVTSIGNYSFQNCTGLTSIEIPNSVTSIGNRAFYGCTGLTSIEIPDSVTSLGYEVFKNCSNLTNAKLGGGITALITDCFNDCSNLKNLSIPDSLNMIDKFVGGITTGTDDALLFNKLTNLTYNVYNNCSYLGNDINPYVLLVKCNDKSISSVTIHPNTKIIGNRAFYNCDSLIEIVIPDNVKMLGYSCFSSCDKLTTVTISASLETIMCRAFSSCKALTSVTFNDVDTWYVKSGTTVDLLDVSVNATYLTSTYKNNNWRKDSQTGCGSVSIYSPFV